MAEYIEDFDKVDSVVRRDLEDLLFRIFQQAREQKKSVTLRDIRNQLVPIHTYENIKCMLKLLENKQYIIIQHIHYEIRSSIPVLNCAPTEILKPGNRFLEWAEKMQKTEYMQIQQQINIGRDINGPFHAGNGDIEITLSEQDMTTLIEIIRMLSSPQSTSPDFVQKIQATPTWSCSLRLMPPSSGRHVCQAPSVAARSIRRRRSHSFHSRRAVHSLDRGRLTPYLKVVKVIPVPQKHL